MKGFDKFAEYQNNISILERSFVVCGGCIIYVGMRNWDGKTYQVALVIVWITVAKCLI